MTKNCLLTKLMSKEINCLIPIIVLLYDFSDNQDKLASLDLFFLKMLENDVLCKNSDFFLLGEKLEKTSQNKEEALNILDLNQQALGLIEMSVAIKTNQSSIKLIEGLYDIVKKIKLNTKSAPSRNAVKEIIVELLNNKINDPKRDIKDLLNFKE